MIKSSEKECYLYPGLALDPSIDEQPRSSPDGTNIAFVSTRDDLGCSQIYVLNSDDGSGQTNISNSPAGDIPPDWGPIGAPPPRPPEEDTTPPVTAVPKNMVVEATTAEDTQVTTYTVTAQDSVDGTATLEENELLFEGLQSSARSFL
jgi:dipeptidyl aminopeptidase/acylaminoacyl peptidase